MKRNRLGRKTLSLAIGLTLGCGTLVFAQRPAGQLPSPSATVRPQPAAKPASGNWFPSWGGTKSDAAPASAQGATPSVKQSDFDKHDLSGEISRARNYERVGEMNKARKIYEELRAKYPKNPDPAYRLGVVADQQRKHGEAEKLFLFAVQINPQNADYVGSLGYCYFLQGRFREAEATLTQAARLAPKDVRIRNNLALALGHQGKYSEALQQFSASGSQSEAYFNLAFVYASQEKSAEAKECFRKSLSFDPTNQRARDALTAFVKYETLPPHLQEADEYYDERGIKWVPFKEDGSSRDGDIRQVSAESAISHRDQQSASDSITRDRGSQAQMRGAPNPILRGLR